MDVRIGISGWTYARWRGEFYPRGLPQRSELAYAARCFNSVEINGSFYSLQRPSSYRAWVAAVPETFVFAVKGSRFLTHLKKLADAEVGLANFYASGVRARGRPLGPFLWPLPPPLGFEAGRLQSFFAALPRTAGAAAELAAGHDERLGPDRVLTETVDPDQRLRHVIEVRHDSFRTEAFYALAREHAVGIVLADNPGRWPILEEVTTDVMYVRLHGHEELYASGYSDAALDAWAARIKAWGHHGQDVYVYCDNDAKVRAPYDAMGLLQRVQAGSVGGR